MPQLSSGLDWILALLGFGFVIFIHELGHFLFAKWAGVKVLRFSIGFGPALWNRRIGETDYCISVLPFGGYVKMLGEDDAADPDSPPEPRSFLAASRGWRALILVGGVLFNLVSSYLILLGLAWRGMPLTPPEVGAVVPELSQGSDSPAKRLGLHAFDRIVVVNGVPVRSFDEVRMQVALAGVHAVRLEVERRGGDGKPTRVALPQGGGEITPAHDGGMPSLGILPPSGNRVQEVASLSGELGSGDPKPGDRILAIDGEEIPLGWKGWTGQRIDARLRRALGADVRLRLERGGQAIDTTIRYGGRTPGTGLAFGLPVRVERVLDGSPAARAGLRAGDFIVAVGDERIGSTEQFIDAVRERGGRGDKVPLTVLRDDQELPITVAPEDQGEAMIGAEVADKLIGRLPYLPAALGAERSALAAAGVAAGDCIVVPRSAADDRRDARDVKAKGISCLVLTGGDPSPLELSDADYKALFDGKNPPGARLIGTQVAAAGNLPKLADGYGSGLDIAWPVDLSEDGRASFATLQAGDWIVDTTFSGDQSPLRAGRHALEVVHNVRGKPQVKAIDPTGHGTTLTFGFDEPPYALERWSDAFPLVNGVAKAMIWGSLQLIPRFFIRADKGGIDATRSLTGPIGIFSELKARSQWLGFASYLKLVALIGLNLFLVNLLPIPIVDGGQLLFLGIEAVMRRPLPAAVRNVATWIGFAIVVSLMLFVLSLDLLRKAGLIGAG